MRVLLGCERSQEVCKAFRELGHVAYSCDLLPCYGGHPEWHIQDDVLNHLNGGWDLAVFFPDCTYLTNSAEWAYGDGPYHQKVKPETLVGPARREAREKALQFTCKLLNAPIKKKALENPIGQISSRIFWYVGGEAGGAEWKVYPTKTIGCIEPQVIHPHWFGDDASKATCIYRINLPKLKPTKMINPRVVTYRGRVVKRWANQTDSGQNNLPPSIDRATIRSRTYPGIAKAMAEQWGTN